MKRGIWGSPRKTLWAGEWERKRTLLQVIAWANYHAGNISLLSLQVHTLIDKRSNPVKNLSEMTLNSKTL